MKIELPKKKGPKPFIPGSYPEAKIRYNIAISLDLLRIKHGLTKWKFQDSISISSNHLNALLNEELGMSLHKLVEICEAYNVTPHWLLGMDENGQWRKDGPWGKKGPWQKEE